MLIADKNFWNGIPDDVLGIASKPMSTSVKKKGVKYPMTSCQEELTHLMMLSSVNSTRTFSRWLCSAACRRSSVSSMIMSSSAGILSALSIFDSCVKYVSQNCQQQTLKLLKRGISLSRALLMDKVSIWNWKCRMRLQVHVAVATYFSRLRTLIARRQWRPWLTSAE